MRTTVAVHIIQPSRTSQVLGATLDWIFVLVVWSTLPILYVDFCKADLPMIDPYVGQ